MVSEPAGRVDVVIVTVPLEEVTGPLPSGTPPLVMVMVPVGPAGTDAVIVTGWPKVLGPEVPTVTVVVNLLTTWTTRFEVSPLNVAVILCEPTRSAEVVKLAVAAETAPVPIVVVPSRNVTTPVLLPGNVAVNVTDCV
jgi:hypothetical protein